jgi:hypothetical protein
MTVFGGPYRTAEEVPVPAPVKVELRVVLWFQGRRPSDHPDPSKVATTLENYIADVRANSFDVAGWQLLAEDVSVAQTSIEPTKIPSIGAPRT